MTILTFKKLVLDRQRSGAISVVTQTETAEYFGWDKAFEEWPIGAQWDPVAGTWAPRWRMNRDPRWPGGSRLSICRAASKHSSPQGQTHCFRMQGGWSRKHLVQLAAVAGDKFEWMENTRYKRVSRDVWMTLARAKRETPTEVQPSLGGGGGDHE
jgi:hypothetical protein